MERGVDVVELLFSMEFDRGLYRCIERAAASKVFHASS